MNQEIIFSNNFAKNCDLIFSQSVSEEQFNTFSSQNKKIIFKTNNSGGTLGGISSGQDIIIKFVVKPTSSILKKRKTINLKKQNTSIITKGRHDPCVGIRAVPVGEAMVAIVLADLLLLDQSKNC